LSDLAFLLPLFSRVRRRVILRSSDTEFCIEPPPEPRGWSESASTTADGGLHVVVLHRYAARWIEEGLALGASTRHTARREGVTPGGAGEDAPRARRGPHKPVGIRLAAEPTASRVGYQDRTRDRRRARPPHPRWLALRYHTLGLAQAPGRPRRAGDSGLAVHQLTAASGASGRRAARKTGPYKITSTA